MYHDKTRVGTGITLDVFKVLVKLRVVDPIINPAEWTKWYGAIKEFVRKYE